MKDLDKSQQYVFRNGVKIMYNNAIVVDYLNKLDDHVTISEHLPDDLDLLLYLYPEKDDQRAKRKFEGSHWYVNMEKHWQRLTGVR